MADEANETRHLVPRVLVVAEDPLARGALARTLGGEPGLAVVAQASVPAEVRSAKAARQPQALVWDVGMHPGSFEALGEALGGDLPVVVLVPNEQVGAAIRAAIDGLVVLAPELARSRLGARPANDDEIEDLTPREKDVLALLVEGLSNKLIAAKLGISEHTAKFHVNALLQKTRASTRTEVVVRAARAGLITL